LPLGRLRSYAFYFLNASSAPLCFTLSLHDALPISFTESQKQPLSPAIVFGIGCVQAPGPVKAQPVPANGFGLGLNVFVCEHRGVDRKSTRLNSSHVSISYAVFCLKKKKQTQYDYTW